MQKSDTACHASRELTPEEQEQLAALKYEAMILDEFVVPSCLSTCTKGFKKHVTPSGYKVYRDQFLAASGNPTDPIEKILLDQLLMAHHQIRGLYLAATEATTREGKVDFHVVAARLLGEFRRTALALKEYRNTVSPKQLTVVGQQNVASGNQQIAYLGGKAASPPTWTAEKTADIKMENKQEVLSYEPQTVSIPQFQTRGGRETEPSLAWSDDAGAAGAASSSGSADPTVGTCDRAQNAHGEGPLRPQRQKTPEGTDLGA